MKNAMHILLMAVGIVAASLWLGIGIGILVDETDEDKTVTTKEYFLQTVDTLRDTAEHSWSRQAKVTAQAALLLDLRLARIETVLLRGIASKKEPRPPDGRISRGGDTTARR